MRTETWDLSKVNSKKKSVDRLEEGSWKFLFNIKIKGIECQMKFNAASRRIQIKIKE